ncbi:MAG: tyrosine-protein phosphatase [Phycisphaerales bacterium]|nr:tyrosine-protein phosphatase [Phycisphaerales bacterium]
MTNPRLIAILALILAAAGAGGCSTVGKPVTGIDNFALVDDGLYRGGQPSYRGITELKEKGVRTVIDLRDDRNPAERMWVEEAGMAYVNIGTTALRVEPAKIATFLKEVDEAQRPIFVHCYHGRDRTGLEIAVYRIVEQNWPRDAALNELYAHGYHWAAFPGIARYLKTFDPKQFK